MRDDNLQVLTLDPSEMLTLFGGVDSFGGDLGKFIGAVLGGAVYLLTHPPEANYAYAKMGYSS